MLPNACALRLFMALKKVWRKVRDEEAMLKLTIGGVGPRVASFRHFLDF